MEQYALITGGTSGLGLAYAKWFAKEGYQLMITGRRRTVIEKRAEELRNTYGCHVTVVLADLAEEQGLDCFLEKLEGKEVDVLVNNAGFGLGTMFADTDVRDIQRLIFLHTIAVPRITHFVLQGMGLRNRGRIINISSDGAFAVVPQNVVYAAAKRFIVTFSQGLHMELAATDIQLQAVCPGFVDSDFHERAGMHVDKTGKGMFAFRQPDDVVKDAMGALSKGRVICIPDRPGKLIKALGNWLPEKMYYKFAAGFAKKSMSRGRAADGRGL